jgi:hypothetical protein
MSVGIARGLGGMQMPPVWEKKFEIGRENPGFLRKQPPFKILATPLTSAWNNNGSQVTMVYTHLQESGHSLENQWCQGGNR